jgi:hypothetical protein
MTRDELEIGIAEMQNLTLKFKSVNKDLSYEEKFSKIIELLREVDPRSRLKMINIFQEVVVPEENENDKKFYIGIVEISLQIDAAVQFHQRKNSIYILDLLCKPSDRVALMGDLQEGFAYQLKTQGRDRAIVWFYTHVFWTAMSLVTERLRSIPVLGLLIVALSWIWRKFTD